MNLFLALRYLCFRKLSAHYNLMVCQFRILNPVCGVSLTKENIAGAGVGSGMKTTPLLAPLAPLFHSTTQARDSVVRRVTNA